MSLLISANKLFFLTQSHRLHNILNGTFEIEVLTPPNTIPYHCEISPETIQETLRGALTGTAFLSSDWEEGRALFVERILDEPGVSEEKVCMDPTVHVELAMIMATVKGEIKNVFPYIGVSKLSCIMCKHYILAVNEVAGRTFATRASHGKAYPGWFWPSLPSCDEELRQAFLKHIRQQVYDDFVRISGARKLSDSTVGSGGPDWDLEETEEDLSDWLDAPRPESP